VSVICVHWQLKCFTLWCFAHSSDVVMVLVFFFFVCVCVQAIHYLFFMIFRNQMNYMHFLYGTVHKFLFIQLIL